MTGTGWRVLVLALFMAPMLCSAASAQGTQSPQSIEEVVHATWMAGVPYETARQFDCRDGHCDYLLSLLKKEDKAPYWPHATKILGIIGDDDRVYETLVSLIEGEDKKGDIDSFKKVSAVYRGRLSALFGLGHLAHPGSASGGSENAMTYLRGSLKPSDWKLRKLSWVTSDEDTIELSISSVHALSITGHREVQQLLRELVATGDVADRTKYAAESALARLDQN